MNRPMWSFVEFSKWLFERCSRLRERGSVVAFEVYPFGRASVRVRIEQQRHLGELTAWDDGSAHFAVVDIPSGDFELERDGVSLLAGPEDALKEFFDLLEQRSGA